MPPVEAVNKANEFHLISAEIKPNGYHRFDNRSGEIGVVKNSEASSTGENDPSTRH